MGMYVAAYQRGHTSMDVVGLPMQYEKDADRFVVGIFSCSIPEEWGCTSQHTTVDVVWLSMRYEKDSDCPVVEKLDK
jgi:hypothetical protein